MDSGRDWPRGRLARLGRDRAARMVAGRQQPQERQQAPQPARPHPGGPGRLPAAARQTAQPGPQEPGPQPQGQLQLLTLGQNHQLPQDQHLGDHGPGPVDQDDALESCKPEVIQITLVPKLHLGTRKLLIVPKLHLGTQWCQLCVLIIQSNQSPTPHPGRSNFGHWNSASLQGGPLIQSSRDYSEYIPASVLAYLRW